MSLWMDMETCGECCDCRLTVVFCASVCQYPVSSVLLLCEISSDTYILETTCTVPEWN